MLETQANEDLASADQRQPRVDVDDTEKALSLASASVEQAQDPPKPPANPWMDPASFPDGGAQAWLTVLGASCCMFVSWGWINW